MNRMTRLSAAIGAFAAHALVSSSSRAAIVSVVDVASIQCAETSSTGAFSTDCSVSSVQGSLAAGQVGDTFQITILFRDALHPDRSDLLHLGPDVEAATEANMVATTGDRFFYAGSFSLTDQLGNPIVADP